MTLTEYNAARKGLKPLPPLKPCHCGGFTSVEHIEPLDGRNTLETTRTCIIKCPNDHRYVSRYD